MKKLSKGFLLQSEHHENCHKCGTLQEPIFMTSDKVPKKIALDYYERGVAWRVLQCTKCSQKAIQYIDEKDFDY